ncbi:hypothetical protein V6N13_024264 [Hibiscus sabdariffa]|uniref:ENTH domain-containing protein n=1 Tax=Hibiscus sabdariffa TaxID=183260 RepID=A0ABR2BWY0_9ROSI
MGRVKVLRDFIGIIKDKASQSKAALISNPKTLSLHLALLRSTTHDPFTPPDPRHLATILSFGHSSRSTASTVVEALMDRLQTTRDAAVAIKCLITVHHIIKRGSFILQDQLSVYPSSGGRNYLKLSNFRDDTTPLTWELSSWVRWYALYLETLLSTSRNLGFFLCSSSSTVDKDNEEDKASSAINSELLKEINSLGNLIEQIARTPDSLNSNRYRLVDEVLGLVGEDYLSSINEVSIRSKKVMIETVWVSISELKDQIGNSEVYKKDNGRLLITGRRNKVSESARFGERVVMKRGGDSVKFSSGRFLSFNEFSFPGNELRVD